MKSFLAIGLLALASMLSACNGMPDGTQRMACSDKNVTVVHDSGMGPFSNGKFCYGPK